MNLASALRLLPPRLLQSHPLTHGLALVGAGGKTTALFQLARSLSGAGGLPVIVTASTHLHMNQVKLADSHWVGEKPQDFASLEDNLRGVMLVTGPAYGDRTTGLNSPVLAWLHSLCGYHDLPLLIEADGSRQRPLKAPAEHEPATPDFVKTALLVTGLSGLGQPLTGQFVHRPEVFARLSGLAAGTAITPDALLRVLSHPQGGLKNIPAQARRLVLLNQAGTPELQSLGGKMARVLLNTFDSVVLGTLAQANLQTFERTAGIILAAGEASRFGQPKQLLDFRGQPFVQTVAQTALASGLAPVVVVTGANAQAVEAVLQDLPVTIIRNPDWQAGQSSSIGYGIRALPEQTGAAVFLLADQPQATPLVIRALVEQHSLELTPILAPLVQDRRANPVLFDRLTFPDLLALRGDVGGRAIFSKYPPTYLPWHDESLLLDVDTPEDLARLKELEP